MKSNPIKDLIGDIKLVERGAPGEEGLWSTLLMAAAAQNNMKATKILLSHGVWINETVSNGWSVLQAAVEAGSVDVVKLLLEKGAAVNACDESGCTVLGCAVFFCDIECVKLLLQYGAKVNLMEDYDTIITATSEEREAIQKLLDQYSSGWAPRLRFY